jgi:PAS domain S-box-containing protein
VQSELTFRQMVDGISSLVAVLTPDGKVEFVNRQVLDYFGKTLEELREWASTDAVHPDDLPDVIAVWGRSVESGQPYDVELRQRSADGVYKWFHVQGLPVRDADGRILRWCVLQTDIDERKRAEEALRQSERELEEALRSTRRKLSAAMQIATVAELSASIAHEINQPLASVVTNAHACQTWLTHDPPNLERAQATLDRIIRDGHSAAEVVRRIRALFKEAAPVKGPLDMNQIVAEVLRVLSDELRDKSIIVRTELEADLPMIEADHVQIQQTLINLVHNAMEAMDGVTDRAKSLLLRSRRQGEELLIEVRDHGVGLEAPALVFEAFFTTKESGMGMGLSICRSIVEAHGGRIWATANVDAGTTFSFTLPLASDGSALSHT